METLIEFNFISEDENLLDKGNYFKEKIVGCELEYIKKGEHKLYENGKKSKLPYKNSALSVKYKGNDYNNPNIIINYNKIIIEMVNVYIELKEYFDTIDCDKYINLSFFDKPEYYFSLEFGEEVLSLLGKYHFSLPISCYCYYLFSSLLHTKVGL